MVPDFSRMGTVALAGSFTGVDLWTGAEPTFGAGTADSLVVWRTTGEGVVSTNDGGRIRATCMMGGTYYVAGEFDQLGNATWTTSINGIAAYTSDGTLQPLGQGINGTIHTLWCDSTTQHVWVGGEFASPVGGQGDAYKGNVAVWDVGAKEWHSPAFGGLNGIVQVIQQGWEPGQLLFGGEFTTRLAVGNTTNSTNTTTITNGTSQAKGGVWLNSSTSSLPSAPLGTLGTNDSTYLSPIPLLTPISKIDGGPSASDGTHADPRALLCAGGGDAAAWWVRDGSVGKATVNLYRSVLAKGVRLGNVLDGGKRGTTSFRIVTIPDNNVRTLTYTDPETLLATTCTESCPLSLASNITAQDFLFSSDIDVTGFQVYLEGWTGDGAGLSLLQLLSAGASGTSSVADENSSVCTGAGVNGTTTVQTTGSSQWTNVEVETSISGTIRRVLTTSVQQSSSNRPSITYYPYISTTGYYALYLTTPGCAGLPPCNERTRNVQVEVFPSRGALPIVTDIDQTSSADQRVRIYEGYAERSSASFGMTVRLALHEQPQGGDGASQWTLVASEVDATWEAAAVNGTRANSTTSGVTTITGEQVPEGQIVRVGNSSSTVMNLHTGFGVYAWTNGTATTISDATALIPPTGQTALDALAYALSGAKNASTLGQEFSVRAFASVPADASSSTLYVGGNFTSSGNYSNLVALDTTRGTISSLPGGGLNGAVLALAGYEGYLFVSGEFTSLTGQQEELAHVARYDTNAKTWAGLDGGVDGVVRGLIVNGTQLTVLGDFDSIVFANGTSIISGGVANYDLGSNTWSRSNMGGRKVWGDVNDAAGDAVVGRIVGVSTYGASGLVTLSGDSSSSAGIRVTGSGIGFVTANQSVSQSSAQRKRWEADASIGTVPHVLDFAGQAHVSSGGHGRSSSWVDYLSSSLRVKRQVSSPAASSDVSAIASTTHLAPSIVTVAYYVNASSSDKEPWIIVGGNFTTLDASASNLGIWNSAQATILPVIVSGRSAADVVGVVHALEVVNDDNQGWLFVGGDEGFGWIDMKAQGGAGEWKTVPALGNGTNSNESGSVLAITRRSTTGSDSNERVIVAGAFTTAGSLGCVGICSWDPSANRWSTLGSGLRSGVVTTAQANGDNLVAGGSFTLSDGTSAVAATYSFSNTSWAALGSASDLPGAVSALTTDDGNTASVWAAGRTDGTPFVAHWDGFKWTSQASSLGPGSRVAQLAFVPLTEKHSGNGSIESDRLLLATGLVRVPTQNAAGNTQIVNSTAALYDGQNWTPLLTGVQRDGSTGSASGLFYSLHSFDFRTKHYLALGLIVLIAIAISTGLVFLIALVGLLVMFCWRPRESSRPAPAGALARAKSNSSSEYEDTTAGASDQDRLRRLGAIQTAIFGEKAAAAAGFITPNTASRDPNYATLTSQRPGSAHSRRSSFDETLEDIGNNKPIVLASPVQTNESAGDSSAPSHMGRPTTMKYPFVGENVVGQDSRELTVKAGDQIHVLEEDDGEQWWFVRTQDGREGLVPASYVW